MKKKATISLAVAIVLLFAAMPQLQSSISTSPSSEEPVIQQFPSNQRGPRVDLLRRKVTRSPAAQRIEMLMGPPSGSDVWTGLTNTTYVEQMDQSGKTVTSRGGFHYCQIGMNFRVAPLSDVNYRHALAHLVPKDRIIGSLFRYLVVKVDTPVPPSQSLWYNAQVDPPPYSPAAAEAILGNANSLYAKVGGVWQYKTGGALETLRFYVPLEITAPTSYTIGRMVVEEAQGIGLLNINLMPMDFATYLDLVYNKWDYEMFWVCYGLGRNPTHLWSLFNSENNFPGSSNPYGINYPDLDAATTILWESLDHDAKVVATQRAQELLMGGTTTEPMPDYLAPSDPRSQALPVFAVYSRNYYDVANEDLAGLVNMYGYGTDNIWTYLNMYWGTANEYRPGTNPPERTVVRVEDEFPERLNPLFATTVYANDFMANTQDGLIAVNPYTHKDEAWLAVSWSYVPVVGGMDVTFNLRLTDSGGNPIQWQDGDPISASDVQFAWDFLSEEKIPNYWDAFKYYDYSTIIDADTIVAHMTTTSQWYVYSLAGVAYMLPPQVWSQAVRNWPIGPTRLATILGWDPSAVAYPDPDGAGPLRAVPTCLFATGPYINMHSTATIGNQAYGDLQANRNYWLTTTEAQTKISTMFHSAGDVDYSGEIDVDDLAAIGLAFNTVPGDDLWNPNADVCGPAGGPPDNSVDIFDAATAGKFFGETETVPHTPPGEPSAPTPVIYIDPPLVTGAFPGDTFIVNIMIREAVEVYAWKAELAFPKYITLLEVVDVTEGDFLQVGGSTFFSEYEDSVHGVLKVQASLIGDSLGVTGDGVLATVRFKVLNIGECPLNLMNTIVKDSSLTHLGHSTEDGYYQTYAAQASVFPANTVGPPPKVGGTFTINMSISGVHDLYVWQAGMEFNATVLEATSIGEGEFLKRAGVPTLWTPGTIDNMLGKIGYSACSLTGSTPGVSGAGQLMNITFRVKAGSRSALNITDVLLLNSALAEIEPVKVINGSVKISPPDVAILDVKTISAPTKYLYVDSFKPIHTDWSTVGASPWLNATGDGNYIEENTYCHQMGAFDFQNITLGTTKIVRVTLEGYTRADSTAIDVDVYNGSYTWLGSLWGETSWGWKSPRWETNPISELVPSTKTEAGLDAFQVIVHYWTETGSSEGIVALDALRLKVELEPLPMIEAYPTWAFPLDIDVVVENQGTATETFDVTVYANTTAIETKSVTLAAGVNTTLVFNWNLAGVPEGAYTIRAEASFLYGEIDTADNLFIDGTVRLKHPGDANGDGILNAYDLGILAKAWETSVGQPLYDPRADFNGDRIINKLDHDILKAHWP